LWCTAKGKQKEWKGLTLVCGAKGKKKEKKEWKGLTLINLALSYLDGKEYEKIFSHKLTYEKIWIAIELHKKDKILKRI
jgi:hypothetical protein